MILNELGSPIEFDFKEFLEGCEEMVNEDIPGSIFLFKGKECNFQIDYNKRIFYISDSLLFYFENNFNIKTDNIIKKEEIIIKIKETLKELYKGWEFEVKFWSDINSALLDLLYKEGKFKSYK